MNQRDFGARGAEWVVRLYKLNAIVVVVALLGFMIMFGVLSGSLFAGLAFPIALPSMALEGDGWGLWMLSPVYLSPFPFCTRYMRDR